MKNECYVRHFFNLHRVRLLGLDNVIKIWTRTDVLSGAYHVDFYVEYVFDKLLVLFMHESWSNTLIFAFFKIFTLIFYTHDTEPEVVFNFHPELQIYSDQAMAEKSICKKNFNCTNISTVLAFHLIFM